MKNTGFKFALSAVCATFIAAAVVKSFVFSATDTPLTAEQMDEAMAAWTRDVIGEPLLWLPDEEVMISIRGDGVETRREIMITSTRQGQGAIRYKPAFEDQPCEVEYSILPYQAEDSSGLIWQDLNGDGVFDMRYVVGANKPLKSEQGIQIFQDGEWQYIESAKENPREAVIGGTRLRFDPASGSWKPE